MKTILSILTLSVACCFNLCAEASPFRAKVTIVADGKTLFSPTTQGISDKPIRFSMAQKVKNNNEKISVGGTLELTATVLEKTVSFQGMATVSDLTGQASKEKIYVTAITAKEFHFSGECQLSEITSITIEGKDEVTYEITLHFSKASTPIIEF